MTAGPRSILSDQNPALGRANNPYTILRYVS